MYQACLSDKSKEPPLSRVAFLLYGSTESNPGHQNAKRFLSEAEKRSRRPAPVSRGSNPRWSTKQRATPFGGGSFAWCRGDSNQNRTPQCGVHRPVQTLVDSSISFPVPRKGKEMQTNPRWSTLLRFAQIEREGITNPLSRSPHAGRACFGFDSNQNRTPQCGVQGLLQNVKTLAAS